MASIARRLAPVALLLTGCVLIVNDDPSTLRLPALGAGSSPEAEDDADAGDADAEAEGFPAAEPACLPPFMARIAKACLPCLASKCAAEFGACCSDDACKGAERFQPTPLLSGIDECLSFQCSDYCLGMECHSSSRICSCIANSPLPQDEECSVSTVPGAICCASFDWPKDGSCECSERVECPSGLKLLSRCNPF